MHLTNIKTRHNPHLQHKLHSKSTIAHDFNDLLISLKYYLEQKQNNHKKQTISLSQKSDLYLNIIELANNNKANQILLCSGPITLNTVSGLQKNRYNLLNNNNNDCAQQQQKFQKQLLALFKYLRRIKQKQNYYFWMIYQDEQLNILNVKLFTKWEFLAFRRQQQQYQQQSLIYKNKNKSKNNSSTTSISSLKNYDKQCGFVDWDTVLLGIFLKNKNNQNVYKEQLDKNRVNSVVVNTKNTGLSNTTTKQSLKCKKTQIKDKSISFGLCYNKKVSKTQKNREKQCMKSIKSPQNRVQQKQCSFIKTNKTQYIVISQPQKNIDNKMPKINNKLSSLLANKTKKMHLIHHKKL